MNRIYAYLLIINAAGFLFMLIDKENAKEGLRRIPERLLFAVAVLGGSLGSLAGMYLVRHKTRHLRFTLGIPIILAVQVLLAVLLFIFIKK